MENDEMTLLSDKLMKKYVRYTFVEPFIYTIFPFEILWAFSYGGIYWLIFVLWTMSIVIYYFGFRPDKYFKDFLFSLEDYSVEEDNTYTHLGDKILDVYSKSMWYDILVLDLVMFTWLTLFWVQGMVVIMLIPIVATCIGVWYWFSEYSSKYAKYIVFNLKLE